MKVTSFEDLKVWKDSRILVSLIYKITSNSNFSRDYGLRDQIQRAAVSVMNNIAEGFERNNNKEFLKFLLYSKGSVGEVRSISYVAKDLNYISEESFNEIKSLAVDISKQLHHFRLYLKEHI